MIMDSNFDRTELESALATFSKAKCEWDNADGRWGKTREEIARVSNKMREIIRREISAENRKAAREKLKEDSQPIYEKESTARMDERKAYAAYIVSSENVAKAGANLLFKAILDNQMQDIPLHHKKFKTFAESVLGEDLVIETSGGLFVVYRMGIYDYNRADVCPIENGRIKLTEAVNPHYVATYDEIVEEVKRAALYFDKIRNAVDVLHAQETTEYKTYRSGAKRLLPSIACTPLYFSFDFTRAAF